MDDRPIGVFDSGFGGLTVARALMDLLPEEDLVYFGDTGRYPCGPRDLDEVREFARRITAMLLGSHDVKMVVAACNTASAAALDLLRFEFDVPVIGVIDPGVRAAVAVTTNGRVGVIGTVGTIASGAYQRAVLAQRAPVTLTCAACPGFVEFVERGETDTEQVHVLAERLLAPLHAARVDTLLLGCTHYPFLARTIGAVVGRAGDLAAVNAVVLSHEHPDHWTDIEGFRVACAYVLGIGGVPVYAPAGLRERAYDLGPALDWQVVEDGDAVEVKGLRLSFSRTQHP